MNAPVNIDYSSELERLSSSQIDRLWRRISPRSKLYAANIAINKLGNGYTFHLRLPTSFVNKLEDPAEQEEMARYIRSRIRKAFNDAGEARGAYWYAYENATKDFGSRAPIHRFSTADRPSNGIVEPHIHGAFALRDRRNLAKLKKLLKRYVTLGRARGLRCVEFGSGESAERFEKHLTMYRLIGPAQYASKNFAFKTIALGKSHFVSLSLKQEAKATMRELLAKPQTLP